MTNESNKPFSTNNPAVSASMTKRQKQNLGMGLVFLAVGVVVFAILKMMEGNTVIKNGQEFVYTVDQNVYLIMFVIALIGVLIILLTIVEYRWQSRTGEGEVNIIDLIRKKEKEPVQKVVTEPIKNKESEPKKEKVPDNRKEPEPIRRKAPEPVGEIVPEPSKKTPELALKKEPEPMKKKEPFPENVPEPSNKKAPEPIISKAPEPIPMKTPEPLQMNKPQPIQTKTPEPVTVKEPVPVLKAVPSKQERFIPIKVEALGRCPMCGKVIVLGQVECFKCGWTVVQGKLVPFDRDADPDN